MSVIKHKGQRVGVFIDTQNLYHSAKHLYNARVNFANVLKDAVADRHLIRAIAYVITTESGEERGFFDALKNMGIETKTKNLQIFAGGSKKADWDVGLAVDAIKIAPKLDAVIIASGDGDFIPLVEYLKLNQGCQVEAICFGKSSSLKLKESVDEFIDMDNEPEKYLMGHTSTREERGPRTENTNKKRPPSKSSRPINNRIKKQAPGALSPDLEAMLEE
ncbi:MAG: hypothetical protein QG585_123 [Patescibacteria group bacterium]|jgi:uncharacterized LabA/DUF88 family protein|nr:hypothetical protein [Patescibacteria group bacterium]